MEKTGSIILLAVPDQAVVQKISAFLDRHIPNISREKVATIVKRAPVVLGKNVSEKAGEVIVDNLKKMGALATFQIGNKAPSEEKAFISPDDNPAQTDTQELLAQTYGSRKRVSSRKLRNRIISLISEVNKELWLILSMMVIVGIMNYFITSHRMLLGFYALPTLFSAYHYGRRHATLTAFASVFLVGLVVHFKPELFSMEARSLFVAAQWYEITAWGSILVITAYAMGTLYERSKTQMQELRSTYHGLLMILRQFISKDDYTENHCYRVSIYAAKIAANYGCSSQQIEDIHAAALLHDIGKLEISRELLYKAARFTKEEYDKIRRHADFGANILEPVGGPLGRIIPIVISHHEKYDGSGYHSAEAQEIPIEARIISIADVYDALVSDRPYRKAMSPIEAKEIIVKGSGTDFDPEVVKAFLRAYGRGDMEIPNVVV